MAAADCTIESDADPPSFGVLGGPATGQGCARQSGDLIVAEWNAPLKPRTLTGPGGSEPIVQLRAKASLDTDPISV